MIESKLISLTISALKDLYDVEVESSKVLVQKTLKEFEGDFTIVVFPFVKMLKKNPVEIGEALGNFIVEKEENAVAFNVVKGFLNISLSNSFWNGFLSEASVNANFGYKKPDESSAPVVLEYSSPNTNKPLHLGHIRNNLLGWSVAEIIKASGKNVKKVNLVNDRGIHICKSMLAWQKWGEGKEPGEDLKGDKLVGDFYVKFDQENKKVIAELLDKGTDKEEAEKNNPLMQEAREMLRKWESNDSEVRALWEKMNNWVYQGFDVTYKRLGVDFDKIYHESETYLTGKDIVLEGLKNGVLYQKDDGSVWADLTDKGLDEKLLLRSDGTSLYMTQDLGTAVFRNDDYNPDKLVYVVGNEQNYHFDVLKIVLEKLGYDWSGKIQHLSYGMVELPSGKMKSREGTVVDADDLMDEMHNTAKEKTLELGKNEETDPEKQAALYEAIGLGALKYFILKVDPKKNMLFNPDESIDFNGNTAPFIQYTYARIRSINRKAAEMNLSSASDIASYDLAQKEKDLLKHIFQWPKVVQEAAEAMSPAQVANYVYDLAKEFNQFYHDHSVLNAENDLIKSYRLMLSNLTATTIKNALALLGIGVVERM